MSAEELEPPLGSKSSSALGNGIALISSTLLFVAILSVAGLLVFVGGLQPTPELSFLFEMRHRLSVIGIVSLAIFIQLFIARSYKNDFDFSSSKSLSDEGRKRIGERWLGIIFCVLLSTPVLFLQRHPEVVSGLLAILTAFAIISPLYFLMLERFGKAPEANDEVLILARTIKSVLSTRKLEIDRALRSSLMNLARNILLKFFFVPTLLASSVHFWGEWEHYALGLYPLLNSAYIQTLNQKQLIGLLTQIHVCLYHFCTAAGTTMPFAGYLLSMRLLGNEVKSTDTTFSGWMFMIISYQPLCVLINMFLARTAITWPLQIWQSNFVLTLLLSSIVPLSVILNTSADLTLGLKFSNVSYRGVISHGLYSIIRHPAYTTKCIGWAFALIPSMIASPAMLIQGILGWIALVALYVMRALTEERHLCKFDDYKSYCNRVRFRFIPGII